MIYQDVKRFLKRHMITPNSERIWGGKDNLLLLELLQNRYSDDEIEKDSSEVRQAFRDFFESSGALKVEFDPKIGMHYTIVPYMIEPCDSRHLGNLIHIIRSHRREIEYPYNGRHDQIALKGKIRRAINAEIIESDESVNKKDLVRYAIKKALELDGRDVVLHLKRKYIIKLFKKNLYLERDVKEPASIDPKERRFQGYNEIDLKNHYKEFFNDIDLEGFLDTVMAGLFANKLNFDEISNSYYENNVLKLVRDAIVVELEQHVSENNEYLKGLSGYIFRHNFESIHQRIAVEIFEQINNRSKNAEKFLGYYSGEIFIENGQKYSIPEITTPDGKRWSVTSLAAIASMWLHTRSKLDRSIVEYKNLAQIYESISITYEKYLHQLQDISTEIQILTKRFEDEEEITFRQMKGVTSEKKSEMDIKRELSMSKEYQINQQNLVTIKQKLIQLKPQREELQAKVNGLKTTYTDLKNKVKFHETSVRELKQNLHLNSDAFHSILKSLVKALMQRKKLFSV